MERKSHHNEKYGLGPNHQNFHMGAYNKHAGQPYDKQHADDVKHHAKKEPHMNQSVGMKDKQDEPYNDHV